MLEPPVIMSEEEIKEIEVPILSKAAITLFLPPCEIYRIDVGEVVNLQKDIDLKLVVRPFG